MNAAISPSEARGAEPDRRPERGAAARLQRTTGLARLAVVADGLGFRPRILYQEGAARLRLPRGAGGRHAVLINTAGGLTGGDRFACEIAAEAGAQLTVTGQAAEKIYRSAAGVTEITTRLEAAEGARLEWLPQPAILFDRSRLNRRLEARLAAGAALLAVEGAIFGRTAMAERLEEGALRDVWRLRRGGRLVFAETFAGEGPLAEIFAGRATLNGAKAMASLVYCADDAEGRLAAARDLLAACAGLAAASAWNGLLVVRFLAPDGQALMSDLALFLVGFRGRPLPRTWSC